MKEFFEIFNIRFWLLLAELLYFPAGMAVGILIWRLKKKIKGGSENE